MSYPAAQNNHPNEVGYGQNMPQQEYAPQYAQPAVIMAQPNAGAATIVVLQQEKTHFGPESMQTYCPQCRAQVQTRLNHECGLCAILVCIFIFGICTYCCSCFKDVGHSCPQCGAFLGRYKRLDC